MKWRDFGIAVAARSCLSLQVAILFPATIPAADFELESRIGPPGSPLQHTLTLRHNAPEIVTADLNDPAIRKLLAEAAGLKDLQKIQDIQLIVTSDNWNPDRAVSLAYYKLRYPSLEAKSLFPSRLQGEFEKYLRTRLVGHTRDFALASVARTRQALGGMEGAKAGLLNMYKEIPESWLKPWEERASRLGTIWWMANWPGLSG